MLGTNPWFKKPRDIGEMVDNSGMVLKVGSVERPPKIFKGERQSKIKSFIIPKISEQNG